MLPDYDCQPDHPVLPSIQLLGLPDLSTVVCSLAYLSITAIQICVTYPSIQTWMCPVKIDEPGEDCCVWFTGTSSTALGVSRLWDL